jgi:limonene-1,2-epoxide hydrolase
VETNERVIRSFIAAWSRLDPKEIVEYFAEDGVYHNMPMGPVAGRDNVEKLIRGFIGSWSETKWELLHVLSSGNVVVTERIDRIRAGDKSVALPVVGVFELEGGKIAKWRDYFDLATYQRAMT